MTFLEYQATNGHNYALHPAQIRGFDGLGQETRVLATIGGQSLFFRVKRTYKDVMAEWRQALEQAGEEEA